MRLLSWNILHGGGGRAEGIVRAVLSHDPDVIVLSEIRSGSSSPIFRRLWDGGWAHWLSTEPPGHQNGIAVLSRYPVAHVADPAAMPYGGVGWLEAVIPGLGCAVGCAYIRARTSQDPGRKARDWNAVLAAVERRRSKPYLLAGDFNTGKRHIDEAGATYHCAEQFEQLETDGWTDVWRHFHGAATEYTWYSRLRGGAAGNGFRIDHAFASPGLMPRVRRCWYSHQEREARVSDHSIMMVELESPSGSGLE